MNKRTAFVRKLVFISLCAAIIAICSLVSFPIGPIPVTLQTFAIALVGYFLGAKNGVIATIVYILIGAIGLPVFAGFKGGFAAIAGPTGGFLIGFILMALLCGIGTRYNKIFISLAFGILGLLACHIFGIAWFAILLSSKYSVWQAFLTASAPFLIKDIISIAAAYSMARLLNKTINKDFIKNK
ncbi:MAG: biotin transporter BioY [Clostridiales bacterium]|nr:MAG: biotin transporter BioY [Clostridiales bacterium]